MGKKGNWFSAVKKALRSESKQKREKKRGKSKGCFWKQKNQELDDAIYTEPALETVTFTPSEEEKKLSEAENEKNIQVYSVAIATAAAAEAAVAAAKAAAEVVRLTNVVCKSKEEMSAIKIQAVFRGYMARRAFRALKGLSRLKTMIQGQSVKRQAAVTLKCMQTMAHVQCEVRARRIRMTEENKSLQRQLEQKHQQEEEENEKMKVSIGDKWNGGTQSKEQVEAKLQSKQEAAIRRERALAYAYTHQQSWRNTPKYTNQTFMDSNNPHWGWSWLERWMASRPWEELKPATEKEPNNDNNKLSSPSVSRKGRPPSRQSPSTPRSTARTLSTGAGRKLRSQSIKGSNVGTDEDLQSMCSVQSDQHQHQHHHRRHSIAGSSSVRDDDSLASCSTSVPGYMTPTKSAKAKSRLSCSLTLENNVTPERRRSVATSTKKRLSFSGSPPTPPRRHSVPPKMEIKGHY